MYVHEPTLPSLKGVKGRVQQWLCLFYCTFVSVIDDLHGYLEETLTKATFPDKELINNGREAENGAGPIISEASAGKGKRKL